MTAQNLATGETILPRDITIPLVSSLFNSPTTSAQRKYYLADAIGPVAMLTVVEVFEATQCSRRT
jgi:hypothetical protein